MKKLVLDSEQINNLTEDEIALLQNLGIALEEKKHNPAARLPKEYDLVIIVYCNLCGSSDLKMYHMTVNKELNGLEAVPVSAVGDKYVTHTYFSRYCKECKKFLQQKSMEEVINLFLDMLSKRFFEK
jgi:hypothetical protein